MMGTFALFGLSTYLLISCVATYDMCNLYEFQECAEIVDSLEHPLNLDKTCYILIDAMHCVDKLWDNCGYDCKRGIFNITDHAYICQIFNKRYYSPMDRKAYPCTIIGQLHKCNDYNCPAGPYYPNPVPKKFSPDLRNIDITFTGLEKLEISNNRECPRRPVEKYLKGYLGDKQENILDCKHCTEMKLNWQYLMEDLGETTMDTCEGSTVQKLAVDIWKLGTQRYVQQCESVKCEASSLSNPLVATCLLAIAYVFSV